MSLSSYIIKEVIELLGERPMTSYELAERIHKRSADGGPEYAAKSISNIIAIHRKRGVPIGNKQGGRTGYRLKTEEDNNNG